MTLCIAAKAIDVDDTTGHGARVVLCFDARVEAGSAFSAETELKIENLSPRWCALVSGNDLYHARALVAAFRTLLVGIETTVTLDAAAETLNIGADLVRRQVADRLTHRECALSLDDFYTQGEAALGQREHDRIMYEIQSQRLEADLLLVGYFPEAKSFGVFRYNGLEHRVTPESHFGAVGSGSVVALANLYQRAQRRTDSLNRVLYIVYESQKLGQNAPGVGERMTMMVLSADSNGSVEWRLISAKGEAALESARGLYGIKSFVHIDLPESDGDLYSYGLTDDGKPDGRATGQKPSA